MGGFCRPARGLPWPCRPGQRPALPPAGGVLRAPPRANARGGGACAASARGGTNCGPPQGQGRRPQGAARLGRWKRRGPRPRYAGRRVRRQSRAARPAPQAWPGWQGWPECRRPGRRGGRPHSPHIVGAGPPRSTCAATERGLCPGQGPRSGPLAGLALRRARVARATAGGQLDRAGLARPWPPHFPDCRRQAGRAAAPPPHRVGRGEARRPRGREGRAPPAGGARTGAPFPLPATLSRQQKRERRRRSLWKPDRKSLVKAKTSRLRRALTSDFLSGRC